MDLTQREKQKGTKNETKIKRVDKQNVQGLK